MVHYSARRASAALILGCLRTDEYGDKLYEIAKAAGRKVSEEDDGYGGWLIAEVNRTPGEVSRDLKQESVKPKLRLRKALASR